MLAIMASMALVMLMRMSTRMNILLMKVMITITIVMLIMIVRAHEPRLCEARVPARLGWRASRAGTRAQDAPLYKQPPGWAGVAWRGKGSIGYSQC